MKMRRVLGDEALDRANAPSIIRYSLKQLGEDMKWGHKDVLAYASLGTVLGLVVILNLFLLLTPQWEPPSDSPEQPLSMQAGR